MAISNQNISLDSITNLFKSKSSLVYWVVFVLLVILEGFVIKDSISIMLSVVPPTPTKSANSVHINFDAYNKAIKRLDNSKTYQVGEYGYTSPFNTVNGK